MLMNELEIIFWSVWLDKNGIQESGFDIETTMLMTAFAVKQYMNSIGTARIFEYHLMRHKPNFTHEFNSWVSHHNRNFRVTPRELCKKWRVYNKVIYIYIYIYTLAIDSRR